MGKKKRCRILPRPAGGSPGRDAGHKFTHGHSVTSKAGSLPDQVQAATAAAAGLGHAHERTALQPAQGPGRGNQRTFLATGRAADSDICINDARNRTEQFPSETETEAVGSVENPGFRAHHKSRSPEYNMYFNTQLQQRIRARHTYAHVHIRTRGALAPKLIGPACAMLMPGKKSRRPARADSMSIRSQDFYTNCSPPMSLRVHA